MNPPHHPGRFYRRDGDRIVCELCPRHCQLRDGQRAFCFVRKNEGGKMVLTTYGRSTGFCIDPIEKKPLNHFYPGSAVLSFGTAGCNLGCRFCQNWDISKARQTEVLSQQATPAQIAAAAAESGCTSVAFTYNDPIIFAEYAIDAAIACHERDVKTVAVTAGYVTRQARGAFFEHIDAANVDLKAFSERFYKKLCFAELAPVLDTLEWLAKETNVWIEVTTLLIPTQNDDEDELKRLCEFCCETLSPETPLHFSAFHPDFKMRDLPRTPSETLSQARQIALQVGLKHVYTGNVHDAAGQSTYCAGCGELLIERDWYTLGNYTLDENGCCSSCGQKAAGRFAKTAGEWGARRQRLRID
jgi:pyruvate formate lyase activating enzyme